MPTPKPKLNPQKSLLYVVCWNMKGVIRYELVKHGTFITADLYFHQLDWINESLRKMVSALVRRNSFILQHDNATECLTKQSQENITSLVWEVLLHSS